jgi:hypothetical protein
MSRYSERDTTSQAADWLMGTARRNPEALLMLAAATCLLMRGGGSTPARTTVRSHGDARERDYSPDAARRARNTAAGMREGGSRAADSATDYASDVKERISDAASGYADSVSEFADDARRAITERSERWQREARSQLRGGMERVLREQPLAVAVAGFAAGAAVAALFPSTKLETQTFGGTREVLADAAGKAGDRVRDAAGKAGERLKEAAEERGLSAEGLKKAASEVADTFTSEMKGKSTSEMKGKSEAGSASIVPDNARSKSGQSFGREQSERGTSQAPGPTPAGFGPGRGTR